MKNTSTININRPEHIFNQIKSKISSIDKFTFLCGFLFCLIMHFFAYTNIFNSHDAIELYNKSDGVGNGRFFVYILFPLAANMSLPWLIGLLTSIFAGFVVLFICKEFQIKNKILICLLSGLFVGYPAVISYHCYFSSVYIYMFAILMSILSVYVIDKKPILSILFMVISLSNYQAFIGFSLALCVIKIIIKLRDTDIPIKTIFWTGIKYILIMCASMIIYYALWRLIMFLTNSAPIKYREYDKIVTNIFTGTLTNCGVAYWWAITMLFTNKFKLSILGFAALLICNVLSIVFSIIKTPKKKRKFNIILFLILPLAVAIIYVLIPTPPYIAMEFPSIVLLLLFINNVEIIQRENSKKSNLTLWIALGLCAVLIFQFTTTANAVYLKLKTQQDNSISYATRLLDRIEQVEGFKPDTEIVLVGSQETYDIYGTAEWSKKHTEIYFDHSGAVTYPWTLTIFFKQSLNNDLNIFVDDDYYKHNENVKKLSSFPAKDCMMWIDGKLIVKISEPTDKKLVTSNKYYTD